MNRINHQATFSEDGYKRIFCRNCGRFLAETHLGQKNGRITRCKKCKNVQIIAPPRTATMNGKEGAYWCEPGDSCFTAFDEPKMNFELV